MKEEYTAMEFEVIQFDSEDVITASGRDENETEED